MEVKIIQLKKMHLDACLDLDQKSLKGLWTNSQWERELNDPKRICLGTFENNSNELIALCSAWLILDELYLTALAVHPHHLRKGFGKNILCNLINRSKSYGITQIRLEVKDTNEPAKAFYKYMGFEVKALRSDFYKDGSNALMYIKRLNQIS